MAKTDYAADKVLGVLVRGVAFAAPTNAYVGLLLAEPAPGGAAVEPIGNGYARVAVPASTTAWTDPATVDGARETANADVVTFPAPTGAGWGTIVGAATFDAAIGGNRIVDVILQAPREVVAGDPISFEPGSLRISER